MDQRRRSYWGRYIRNAQGFLVWLIHALLAYMDLFIFPAELSWLGTIWYFMVDVSKRTLSSWLGIGLVVGLFNAWNAARKTDELKPGQEASSVHDQRPQ